VKFCTEADLGMFSMFGRTGAPTKKGPPQEDMGRKKLCYYEIFSKCRIILNNFVALNLSYSTPSVLCAYDYVMRVFNKMSMMTTLSLCVSCEFSRAVFVLGRGPHIFF